MLIWNRKRRGLHALTIALLAAASIVGPGLAADTIVPGANSAPASAEDLTGPAQVTSAVAQAEIQRRAGDLAGAMKTLSQLVLAAPDDARVLGAYGKTMVAQGRADDALAFLERAVELQPNDWTLYSAQGVAYDQKGNYKAAQAAYAKALGLKPNEPTVLSNAALSHMQAGDLDGAERLLLQAQPNGAAYPRIAQNLTMVQGLKEHMREAQAAAPKTEVAAAPKAPATVANGTSPPAPAPLVAPKPVLPAQVPVASAPLAPPAPKQAAAPVQAPVTPATAATKPPAQLSGLAGLMNDPTVRVQALPKADQPVKTTAVAPKAAEEKLAAAKPASEGLSLRPAMSDTDKRKPATTKQ